MDLNGSELDTRQKASTITVKRLKTPAGLPKFGNLFIEYAESLDDLDYLDEMSRLLVAKFKYPDTIFYIAFNEEKEPVGFLWAEPNAYNGAEFIGLHEIFSKEPGAGEAMFDKLIDYGRQEGFISIKGLVKADRAEAIARMFDADIEAVQLSLEL